MEPKPGRALLVEDSPDLSALFVEQARVFTDGRLAVACAETLAEAIRMLRQARWDVVVVDLGLPDSSGYDTFAAIMAEAQGAPVFVLSGRADPAIAERTARAGGAGFLLKGAAVGPDLFDRLMAASSRG